MFRADLVAFREGRPIVVVEAKGRPVQARFHRPVVEQLSTFSTSVNSPWLFLVDPQTTQVFRSIDGTRPVATISTREILQEEMPNQMNVIGEKTLLFAFDRWLLSLPQRTAFFGRHPELQDLAKDLSNHITTVRDWWPGRSGGG